MSKYRNTVYYDFKSRFLVIFSGSYRHQLVLKIPFSDHIFPKISKYCTENLRFSSTGKYYAPPSILRWNKKTSLIVFKGLSVAQNEAAALSSVWCSLWIDAVISCSVRKLRYFENGILDHLNIIKATHEN